MSRRMFPGERLPPDLPFDSGLASAAVQAQRQRFGSNDIAESSTRPWWQLLRDTAADPMIWFLGGTSALYAGLGDRLEALTLLAAAVPLIGMDALLHRRTQASTAGLRSHLAAQANVVRDGIPTVVPALDVVPGDLAVVRPGETFPADGVLVGARDLNVEEAVLTGESFPVRKHALAPLPGGGDVAVEAEHWGLAGTRVLTGEATLRVVFTGSETLYGEIVHSVSGGNHERTPLQAAIAELVKVLVVAAAIVCVALAAVRLYQGHGWADALVSALTLAVAAMPEEFPVVFTFFLGVGVYRLARRQALVRRAVSVENIGRVSCICTDKTGTITVGQLELTHLVPAVGIDERRLLQLAMAASRSVGDDPLDVAILRAAAAHGLASDTVHDIERIPFSEDSRRESAVVRLGGGDQVELLASVKGSAEVVLDSSHLEPAERLDWERRIDELASGGHKVIACAWQPLTETSGRAVAPARGYAFLGLLAFEDPVRDGVAGAVATCREADIHVLMVTGDHPLTAAAVAREIGLGSGTPRVMLAQEMEEWIAAGREAELRQVDVVARAVPTQKLDLVRAMQRLGEVVAVTGDGVNDVPALQAADVGIAMGERGTRSAREIASIVLLDDNFRTIVGAIAEGRALFGNLRLSFAYLLMIHLPLVTTAALIPLLGHPVLYLPIHIVWLELIIHPTAMLVFQDLPASEQLAAVRRSRETRFFAPAEWLRILFVGLALALVIVGAYEHSLAAGASLTHARTIALAVLIVGSATITAGLSRLRSAMARWVAGLTLGGSILLIQLPVLAEHLHLEPLQSKDWLVTLLGVGLVALPLLPWLRRRKG